MNAGQLRDALAQFADGETVLLMVASDVTEIRSVERSKATYVVQPEWAADGIGGPVENREVALLKGV